MNFNDFNEKETTEMSTNARIFEYRVYDDEKVHASGEVIVPADQRDPEGTARDLAVADFVQQHSDIKITDVTVMVRAFTR